MPDLDQIKQEEQERGTGAGGFARARWAIPPAGRAAAATRATVSHVAAAAFRLAARRASTRATV
jgi:hypothetical protein